MNYRTRSSVAIGLFVLFALAVTAAQTSDTPKKNCTAPVSKRREDARPPRSSRTNLMAAVSVLIDEQGRVADATLKDSSGDDEYDGNVLDAIKYWTFKPSLCNGKPSSIRVTIEFKFMRHVE